ncbi:dolichyl-phosphate-mannose-protein mannosyltransferase [Candidatus Moduliflexus flocculans]|uniref:Dolichyl-phosphate-mannose-protein mannosyltransferase n=1 Tax=Candidatus Moduliflexus flocculans TaxID=1499966 RepID=A0A0S6W405_9BACT|nr:dolichyl-phosphate-mannose-protein mannosyltransferase [Candidatus Moduliflexus flocculans]
MSTMKVIFLCLFLLGSGIRAIDVWRPVDGRVRESWRECDIASIARNYYREGMNLFYPRIDWRGDGPGYTEMEFPLYPWLIAILYKIVGFHEILGRILAYLFSLATMGVFFQLVRYLLPDIGAIAASLFFVLSPLSVRISNSLQPEGLMFLCYVLAAYAFIRWLDNDSWIDYGIAVVATMMAILAKANAAHIGIFFAVILFWQKGLGVLKRARIWIFAIVSLLPAILWYRHAHALWLTYGNSLGISNEYHWIGWDFFTTPTFIVNIGYLDARYVWMFGGVIIAGIGIVWGKTSRAVRYSLYWFATVMLYYVIAARTTGELWATYYHVVSIPPVAILIGAGTEVIAAWTMPVREQQRCSSLPLEFWRSRWKRETVFFAIISLLLTVFLQLWQLKKDVHPMSMQGKYACALQFAGKIPSNVLIVASGGNSKDENGYPIAYNASYFFYWLDRKGFNIPIEEQSVENLRAFARRGARYFIAETWHLHRKPEFEAELRKNFNVLQECRDVLLVQLTTN